MGDHEKTFNIKPRLICGRAQASVKRVQRSPIGAALTIVRVAQSMEKQVLRCTAAVPTAMTKCVGHLSLATVPAFQPRKVGRNSINVRPKGNGF